MFFVRSMWLTYKNFFHFVKKEWVKAPSYSSPMRIVMCRLRHLRAALRHWNYAVLGDLNRQIEKCSLKLEMIQQNIETLGFFEELHFEGA